MSRRLPLFSCLLLFCACGSQKEREPNDNYATAGILSAGSVEGHISTPGDVDIYKLEVSQESAILSLHVGGIRDIDFVLGVRDKDQVELKRYDETGVGGDEEALDIGVHRGTYYIVVSNKNEKARNPDQPYLLDVKVDKAVGREVEPNDTLATASVLDLPGLTRGHYFPARNLLSGDTDYMEQDWFRLDVVQSGLFLLNIDLSGVPKIDPIIEIYDNNGYKIKEVDSHGMDEGESIRNFGVHGPAQWRLRLRSKHKAGNAQVPYEILTELLPYQGKVEFEPNDQRPDATPFDGDSIEGTIAPQGDSDWYKVTINDDAKQILRAGLSGVDGMDLTLRLCDNLGQILVEIDNMGVGQPETLTGIGASKGDYYLVVAEKSGRKADNRKIYTLSKSVVPFQAGLEFETNDSTASAQAIKIGESVDGYIAPKGDVDFYQFNVYNRGVVGFELAGIVNVQFIATLFDQEYRESQSWTAAKAGEALSFEKQLEPGTYFLKIRAGEASQNNTRDKYSLRLRLR